MGITALVCPQCGANIQIDSNNEYGYCSYCGAKLQLHTTVRVEHIGSVHLESENSLERLTKNAITYVKTSDWENLFKTSQNIVSLYPDSAYGYYFEICSKTQNFSYFGGVSRSYITNIISKIEIVSEKNNNTIKIIDRINAFVSKYDEFADSEKKKNEEYEIAEKKNQKKRKLMLGLMLLIFIFVFAFVWSLVSKL